MGRKKRRSVRQLRTRRDPRELLGILLQKRDEHLNEDYRQKRAALRDERERRLLAMGFSPVALYHVKTEEEAEVRPDGTREDVSAPIPYGVADAYLEQTSRHFHGVPPDATDKKQGRKRKGGASPDPARFVPAYDQD